MKIIKIFILKVERLGVFHTEFQNFHNVAKCYGITEKKLLKILNNLNFINFLSEHFKQVQ